MRRLGVFRRVRILYIVFYSVYYIVYYAVLIMIYVLCLHCFYDFSILINNPFQL